MSGINAGNSRIGSSSSANGFCTTRQSGRCATRSLPSTPRNGMKGTPFSAACNIVWIAGHVASITSIVPAATAAENRGASPASPSVTALVCTDATHPAPISRSVT